ncbi:hypothetical protein [Mucilaginibacter paludis]|uniref:Uncharacterized protein n=1 Tax=Mucilaginibacter paludis DSM 18603 TaxID=714943 RepID=H1Y8W6_9SPHI|nr:hypothetical protein [Mucilaginibacter paludis]EHQ28732.1 hypothetical protein Mucpa_4645 [Mucilaginibacter paludis DSM 18603]
MDEVFQLPVSYQDEELELEARIMVQGYLYRIEVMVNGIPVLFEPDEERNYRALVSMEQLQVNQNALDVGLLKAIASRLESINT